MSKELDMLSVGWRIWASKQPWSQRVGLWMVTDDALKGAPALITKVELETQEEGFQFPATTTFDMPTQEMQSLVNQLWDLGIRPVQALESGSDAHLQDMRKIAFHKLGIKD